ncbi:MAG: ArsR/SmtB family transcription factor [Acholeplasmataceae bacterium]
MNVTDQTMIFKALSDDTRLSIFMALTEETKCACQLLEGFSIAQSTLSHHMKILIAARLVDAVKQGKWVYYQINEKTCDALKTWITSIKVSKHKIILCEKTEKEEHYESI